MTTDPLEALVLARARDGLRPAEQRRALMNKAGLSGARLRLERARYEQSRAMIVRNCTFASSGRLAM